MPRHRSQKDGPAYEAPEQTKDAIERIRSHFTKAKAVRVAKKKFADSPEGILRSSIEALLATRKAMRGVCKDLDRTISALQSQLPGGA